MQTGGAGQLARFLGAEDEQAIALVRWAAVRPGEEPHERRSIATIDLKAAPGMPGRRSRHKARFRNLRPLSIYFCLRQRGRGSSPSVGHERRRFSFARRCRAPPCPVSTLYVWSAPPGQNISSGATRVDNCICSACTASFGTPIAVATVEHCCEMPTVQELMRRARFIRIDAMDSSTVACRSAPCGCSKRFEETPGNLELFRFVAVPCPEVTPKKQKPRQCPKA
ncbi:hypothetical protein ABH999_000823 [Bradyrhizobium yuanmingense]